MKLLSLRRQFNGFDLQAALRQGIVYGILIFVVAGIFFSAEFITEKFFYNNDEVVDIVSAVAGAFAFSRLRDACASLTDRIFFRGQYDYADAIQELGRVLGMTIELRELVRSIAEFLAKTIKPETIIFHFEDAGLAEPRSLAFFDNPAAKRNRAGQDDAYRSLATQCRTLVGRLFFIDELANEAPVATAARGLRIAAIVPFFSKDGGAAAFMLVGQKLSGELLRQKDKALLTVVAHQAGMAIENAQLYATLREHAAALEHRVAEKTERLKEMYRAQSKFLADLAHEFQTPIAILTGNLGLLSKNIEQSERTNALYVAMTTLDRLSRLVQNLLDIARLNFSKNGLLKRMVAVNHLLKEIREDCAILAEDKGVALVSSDADPPGTAENIFIAGDKDKLKEVLLNLVSNALKHTPASGTISLAARRTGDVAEIVVADTGRGIAPENLSRVFERFYKIDKRGISETTGNGIGLHICRQIVEAHGGTIVAESEPGRGSRFVIHLPLASRFQAQAIADAETDTPSAMPPPAPEAPQNVVL